MIAVQTLLVVYKLQLWLQGSNLGRCVAMWLACSPDLTFLLGCALPLGASGGFQLGFQYSTSVSSQSLKSLADPALFRIHF